MGFDFVAFTSGTASALASVLRADKDTGSGKSTIALKDLQALEQRLGVDVDRGAGEADRASTRGAPTRSTRARSCSGPRSSSRAPSEATLCETALREGIIADYVASNRPGMLLVEEFPDLRRADGDGAGAPLPVPRGRTRTHVARLALSIFDQTRRLHKLPTRRRRAARVRGAAARHRLLHLAPPPPPAQRVPDPEPRDDRLLARRGPHHRAGARHHRKVETEARARPDAPALEGRQPTRPLPGGDPAHRRRAGSHARAAGARGAVLGVAEDRRRAHRRRTAIPSSRSGRRAARATCSRSCPSGSCVSPSTRSASREERPRRAEPAKPEDGGPPPPRRARRGNPSARRAALRVVKS